MDIYQFPRYFAIHIKAGEYEIKQISNSVFLVQNWDEKCPLDKNFILMDGQYVSDEPVNNERREAIKAILDVLRKESQYYPQGR